MGVRSSCWQKQLILFVVAGALCLLFDSLTVCEAAPPDTTGQAPEKEYLIGIGDILDVSVWHEPDISKSVFVRLDGRISLPLIGDVFAKGLSPESLADKIGAKLATFIADPSVTVTLTDGKSRIYYVLGQVARPGEYALNYPVSIVQAIARAGGFAEWAKKDKVIVVRKQGGKETMIHFDYDTFVDGKERGSNVALQPGDTLIIP